MNSVDAINFVNNHTAQGRQSCKERNTNKERHSTFLSPPSREKKRKEKEKGSKIDHMFICLVAAFSKTDVI